MSYCRFGWDNSDVYVYESSEGIECCGCQIQRGGVCLTRMEMIQHLAMHLEEKQTVPRYVFERLLDEIYEEIPVKEKPPHQKAMEKMMGSVPAADNPKEKL